MTAECRNLQEEFMDVNFVDQRLKTRFFKIMDAIAIPRFMSRTAKQMRLYAKVMNVMEVLLNG